MLRLCSCIIVAVITFLHWRLSLDTSKGYVVFAFGLLTVRFIPAVQDLISIDTGEGLLGMRTVINWGVIKYFAIIIVGFFIAGFLVSDDAKTDDGHPLNIFFWAMGGLFGLSTGAVLVYSILSNKKRERIENTWLDAQAEVIDVSETGTYINNQPRLEFRLKIDSPVQPPYEVIHKQVIPLTALASFGRGKTISLKVNPDNPEDILLI